MARYAPAIEAGGPRRGERSERGTRLGAKHESAATPEAAGATKNEIGPVRDYFGDALGAIAKLGYKRVKQLKAKRKQ
jgi:hypothetical protein